MSYRGNIDRITGASDLGEDTLSSSISVGVGTLERGKGRSAAEGARCCFGDGLGGLGGVVGLCSCATCAFGGIARGGGCGLCLTAGGVSVGGSATVRTDSVAEGRPSLIFMTSPLLFPDGASISNSGKPDGGLEVYRLLPLRTGPFFLNDDMLGKICSALSEAIV